MIYLFNTESIIDCKICMIYNDLDDYLHNDQRHIRSDIHIKNCLSMFGYYSFIDGIIIDFNKKNVRKHKNHNIFLNLKRIFDIKELLV